MSRVARVIIPGQAHHITQRGNNRQVIFEEDADYLKYCHWMNKYSVRNGLKILAYCLMANHVHFIGIPALKESLCKTFHIVHSLYAWYFNKKKEACGHLWQGRFYSCPLGEQHMYRAIRYVEQNPVRGQIVKKAWQYPWSSAKWHVGMVKSPHIHLAKTEIIQDKDWKNYLAEEDKDFKL